MAENYSDSEQQGGYGRHYVARPKFCQFCVDKNIDINYKNIETLRRFVTDDGRIRPRRQTGTCAKHQRALAGEVKRARHIALLPFTSEAWTER
jgi:small subunit ribosomal protein S18